MPAHTPETRPNIPAPAAETAGQILMALAGIGHVLGNLLDLPFPPRVEDADVAARQLQHVARELKGSALAGRRRSESLPRFPIFEEDASKEMTGVAGTHLEQATRNFLSAITALLVNAAIIPPKPPQS